MDPSPFDDPYTPELSPGDEAFKRWCMFMAWPGFGWVGLAIAWNLGEAGWSAASAALTYVVLYVSAGFAFPGLFAAFWREIGQIGPAKLREMFASIGKFGRVGLILAREGLGHVAARVLGLWLRRAVPAPDAGNASNRESNVAPSKLSPLAQSARDWQSAAGGTGEAEPVYEAARAARLMALAGSVEPENPAPVKHTLPLSRRILDALSFVWRVVAGLWRGKKVIAFILILALAFFVLRPFWGIITLPFVWAGEVIDALTTSKDELREEVKEARRETITERARALDANSALEDGERFRERAGNISGALSEGREALETASHADDVEFLLAWARADRGLRDAGAGAS